MESKYGIVAFYHEKEAEISAHAAAISAFYHLQLRYEKLPDLPVAVSALVEEGTVLCILERSVFPFRKLLTYVYALNKPVIIVHQNDRPEVFHRLKVPVGYLQENKEKVVWANFFQRNNAESRIVLRPGNQQEYSQENDLFLLRSGINHRHPFFPSDLSHPYGIPGRLRNPAQTHVR